MNNLSFFESKNIKTLQNKIKLLDMIRKIKLSKSSKNYY